MTSDGPHIQKRHRAAVRLASGELRGPLELGPLLCETGMSGAAHLSAFSPVKIPALSACAARSSGAATPLRVNECDSLNSTDLAAAPRGQVNAVGQHGNRRQHLRERQARLGAQALPWSRMDPGSLGALAVVAGCHWVRHPLCASLFLFFWCRTAAFIPLGRLWGLEVPVKHTTQCLVHTRRVLVSGNCLLKSLSGKRRKLGSNRSVSRRCCAN